LQASCVAGNLWHAWNLTFRFAQFTPDKATGRLIDVDASANHETEAMMPTGSERLPASMEPGRISLRKAIGKWRPSFNPYLYRDRDVVERFFNKIKPCLQVA